MKIHNQTGVAKIDEAIDNFLLIMPFIIDDLLSRPSQQKSFTYTNDTDSNVGFRLRQYFNSDIELTLKLYKPMWPWSKTIGYSDGTTTLYINSRKLDMFSANDYAGNIGHEFCHYPCMYEHGSNSPVGKDKSVPYFIGNLIAGRK